MLTFEPLELETQFRRALAPLTDAMTVCVGGEDIKHDFALDSFEDLTLTADTEVTLAFPYGETDADLSIGDLIELADEVADSQLSFDGLIYHSSARTLLRVMSWDMRSNSFAEKVSEGGHAGAEVTTELRSSAVSVGLRDMSPHYAAAIVLREQFYDKYQPPVTPGEIFVEVTHPRETDKDAAMAVIYAYLFELHTTLGLEYFESPRPIEEPEYSEDEEISDLLLRAKNLRPLLLGQGLPMVLQEFNRGHAATDSESALLCYVKCIEYVAATVVREKQYEDLRKRLLSREALNPNANYLDGLLTLFEENRVLTRDSEALRLSVGRCCDPLAMAPHAPKFLRALASISPRSSAEERKSALCELAAVLSASRNQLAHAKANYKATGKECPIDQLQSLVACSKLAAEQCIRWYAARSPELRRG